MIKRLLVLGAISVLTGAGVRLSTAPMPAVARTPTPTPMAAPQRAPLPFLDSTANRPRWEAVWTRPAPGLAAMTLAADGSSAAWVDGIGSVRRIVTSTAKTVWQSAALPGVNQVRVSPQGTVLAFSRMNPAKPAIRLLDPVLGDRRSVMIPVDGAVWQAALTPDGDQAVVTTGKSCLYYIRMRLDAVWPGVPIKLSGIADSVAVATADPVVILGTWQDGGVCAWGLDHAPRWRHEERQPDRGYAVTVSADGGTAVAISAEGTKRKNARLYAWDVHTGRLLWIEDLNGFDARTAVSANGQSIAVTYAQMSSYRIGNAVERRVVVFDRVGQRLFAEKGGSFFSPELLALSADGSRLTVKDDGGNIWTLDSHGHTVGRMRLPADPKTGEIPSLRDAVATTDGKYLLIYRGDGQITLFRATAG